MATTGRYIIVRNSRLSAARNRLKNHPLLDPRGGGYKEFSVSLALTTDPDDGSVTRGRLAYWRLPDEWWNELKDEVLNSNWKVNSTDNDNDVSHYKDTNWTLQEVLDDLTRKPKAVQIVPAGVPL